MEALAEIERGLAAFDEDFRAQFAAATSEQTLRAARAELLGKKGRLTQLLKLMGQVPAEHRKEVGEAVNRVKSAVEESFEQHLKALADAARLADLNAPPFDLSLPGRVVAARGHLHPITQVKNDILDTFRSLGFSVAWGPQVELETNNFTKLAFPPDHPATDMQDSFWVRVGDEHTSVGEVNPAALNTAQKSSIGTLLRTHTSNVQVREMSRHKPPMAVVSGGAVYRRDDDVTHSPMFHQVEGFWVAEGVSFAHLKGVITAFAQRMYGESLALRFRPSYFPFVEPGAEVDIECVFCTESTTSSCRVCKSTRWLEILGCGMIHPAVLTHCGIDPEKYTGFAFGLGVERIAMLRYAIPDIRLLFENDPRFLAQF